MARKVVRGGKTRADKLRWRVRTKTTTLYINICATTLFIVYKTHTRVLDSFAIQMYTRTRIYHINLVLKQLSL